MPTPAEYKTVQARILAYAQEIGWTYLPREEARQRRLARLKGGIEFPVPENSPEREKHGNNGESAQQVAALMKVSDFSVKAADRTRDNRGAP